MRRIGLIGLTMVLLTACSGGSDSPNGMLEPGTGDPGGTAGQGPAMSFSAVFADKEGDKPAGAPASQGVTRSGEAPKPGDGEFTTADLQASGFGVYCWYTGDKTVPDNFVGEDHIKNYTTTILMLNQKVEYIDEKWTYSPTRYWPLNSEEKLTFRAYAPYVSYQLQTDDYGMPMLPVVLGTEEIDEVLYGTDYHKGTQHDPLWGTARHGGSDDDAGTTYGVLYNNYTYKMSGDITDEDARDGYIDWYFHHGMSKLMFSCSIIKDPGCSKVTIKSITIENLYTQGLLSLGSKTASASEKPSWEQRAGNMTVTFNGATTEDEGSTWTAGDLGPIPDPDDPKNPHPTNPYPFVFTITDSSQPTGPYSLLSKEKGLLIIPRDFNEPETPMKITIVYTIDDEKEELKATKDIDNREFFGNTSYTLYMKLTPSTKGLEITTVQAAFTEWIVNVEKMYEVYNW